MAGKVEVWRGPHEGYPESINNPHVEPARYATSSDGNPVEATPANEQKEQVAETDETEVK